MLLYSLFTRRQGPVHPGHGSGQVDGKSIRVAANVAALKSDYVSLKTDRSTTSLSFYQGVYYWRLAFPGNVKKKTVV